VTEGSLVAFQALSKMGKRQSRGSESESGDDMPVGMTTHLRSVSARRALLHPRGCIRYEKIVIRKQQVFRLDFGAAMHERFLSRHSLDPQDKLPIERARESTPPGRHEPGK
jgi:hypothetical protein